MLLPQALLTATLAFYFMHSSLGSSSVTVTPSLTATSNSTIGTTSPTVVNSTTTKQGNSGGSSLLSKGGHRMTTVSIAKSVDHSVNQTATVSIGYAAVRWSSWRVENTDDCQKKCCDTGGPVIRQIRNCTIITERCIGLNRCSHYGPVERDVSCYTVCDCMHSLGHFLAAPVIMTIMSNILAVTW